MNRRNLLKALACGAILLNGLVAARAMETLVIPDWGLGPFLRPEGANPIVKPSEATFDCPLAGKPIHWEATHTFNPAAAVLNGKVYLLYRAEDASGNGIATYTSRLGLAISEDGVHFKKQPTPTLYPDHDDQEDLEWKGGCEDPRLVEGPDGEYFLTYTQFSRKGTHLGVATTKDFVHWQKHGPAFAKALDGRYKDVNGKTGANSKSGAIVCSVQDGTLRAVKINGKYWMYWGEGEVELAWSENLLDWTVVEESSGKPLKVIPTRAGKFDSNLTEGGPCPILTDKGILVLFNGKNADGEAGDQLLGPGAYAAGQALFDKNDPTKLLERSDKPFYQPEADFEKTGQYVQGTTFIEGLVLFQGKWMLYYGCADSFVAMAICDPSKPGATLPKLD